MARPSKYEQTVQPHLAQIKKWRRDGAKVEWIAQQFPVAVGTFYEYKKKYPELNDALKEAETVLYTDMAVTAENNLKAKLQDRWETTEETLEVWTDESGKIIKQHKQSKKRLILADTTALIFTLKNRNPENWRDRTETEISGNVDVGIIDQYLAGKHGTKPKTDTISRPNKD